MATAASHTRQQTHLAAAIAATAALAAAALHFRRSKRRVGGGASTSSSSSSSSPTTTKYLLLAGDVGGTNTRLALYDPSSSTTTSSAAEPLHVAEYLNSSMLSETDPNFERDLLEPFLASCSEVIDTFAARQSGGGGGGDNVAVVAALACAGPVRSNRVSMTNIGGDHPSDDPDKPKLELVIDGNRIASCRTNGGVDRIVACRVVNDFVGQGYGALDLDLDKETIELTPDSKAIMDPLGPKACVGAGTGLGECYLTLSSLDPSGGYECYPSEGGHVEFAPRTDIEMDLLAFLKDKFAQQHRVSVERVVSGKGLANVYEFLASKFPNDVDRKVHDQFWAAGDMQGKIVGTNASTEGSLCHRALEIMASTFGSEVGSAALKFIPTGGMYVCGGLTPKNIECIRGKDSPFMKAYRDKGRVSPLLDTVPLFAVMVEDLGLRGARVCALREYKNLTKE